MNTLTTKQLEDIKAQRELGIKTPFLCKNCNLNMVFREHMSEIGTKGGRPRQPSVSELLSGEIKEERLPNDLKGLKSLFAKKLEGAVIAAPGRGAG